MRSPFVLLFIACAILVSATDLYVKEFGGAGAYSTINDALTAASSEDRILILPKAGSAPYIENLTLDKSIQLLSAQNGSRFFLQGNIDISTSLPAGAAIVIDGLNITSGNIAPGSNSVNQVTVDIVNSALQNGYIRFGQNFRVNIAGSTINSSTTALYAVEVCKGNILGNTISSPTLGLNFNNDAVSTSDTFFIVGNDISVTGNFSTSSMLGLSWSTTSYFYFIANNTITQSNTTYSGNSSVTYNMVTLAKKAGTNSHEINTFLNNTVSLAVTGALATANVVFVGIRGTTLDNRCLVLNNLVHYSGNATTRNGFNVSGTPQFSYNNVSGGNNFNAGTATDPSNTSMNVTFSGGCIATNQNLGHPDPIFTDLDLTRNDWGACGGSFNIAQNYQVAGTAGSAKVHLVLAPRRVLQGSTLNVTATGHDR